mgnify:CR=1 FL=1
MSAMTANETVINAPAPSPGRARNTTSYIMPLPSSGPFGSGAPRAYSDPAVSTTAAMAKLMAAS